MMRAGRRGKAVLRGLAAVLVFFFCAALLFGDSGQALFWGVLLFMLAAGALSVVHEENRADRNRRKGGEAESHRG